MKRAAVLLIGALLAPLGARAGGDSLEQRIKTAFLVNFARFATWPPRTFADAHAPIELCVLAGDAFGQALADVGQDKTVNGRPLRISRVFRADDLRHCQVAYLEDPGAAAANLATLVGHHVLTVYEGESTQPNGMIRFYVEHDHVRFEVNIAAARREEVDLSSRMLGLAKVVEQ